MDFLREQPESSGAHKDDPARTEDNSPEGTPKRTPDADIVTVSGLNQRVRRVLEGSFAPLWVRGEISNFTRAPSGHWYFSLKDANAQVRCTLFRGRNQLQGFLPADGMAVEAYALVSLYEARGEFQLNIETLRRAGVGSLYERFAALKARLLNEGLFDEQRKRALPRFPRTIGVITSPAAAALRDVRITLERRAPHVNLILYPAPVQGETAAALLAAAIATANTHAECEVLLLCRGGGSIEDLWAFNEEVLARAIAASRIPIVSGIGHETDFTIADFVADQRAATPTAAAQLAVPSREDLLTALQHTTRRLQRAATRRLENAMQTLDSLQRRLIHPRERIARQHVLLQQLAQRLSGAAAQLIERRAWRLHQAGLHWQRAAPPLGERAHRLQRLHTRLGTTLTQQLAAHDARLRTLASNLDHLNPQAVLERGYSIARKADGSIVRDAAQLNAQERLALQFARGEAEVSVVEKNHGK